MQQVKKASKPKKKQRFPSHYDGLENCFKNVSKCNTRGKLCYYVGR